MMETDIGVIGQMPENEIVIAKPDIAASHTLGLQDLYKAAFSQEPRNELPDFGKESDVEIHTQLISDTSPYVSKDESTTDKTEIAVATNLEEAYQLYTIKTVRPDDDVKAEEIGYSDNCVKIEETPVVLERPFEAFQTIDTNSVLDLDKGIQIQVIRVNDATGGPSDLQYFHGREYTGDSQILQRYLNDASFLKSEASTVAADAIKFVDKPYKSYLDNSSVGVSPEALGVRFEDCDFNSSDSFASTESIIPKNINCPKCPKKFMFKSDLIRHDKYKHSVKPKLSCEFCNKEFASQQNLMFHEKSHKKRSANRCEVCQKVFKKLGFLVKHMMKKHSKVTSFPCGQCEKTFSSRMQLGNHRRKVHGGSGGVEVDRPYRCQVCSKTFEKKHGLSCHVKTHDQDQLYTCNVCSKTFAKMQYLKSHLKCHAGEEKRDYSCETCSKIFKTSSALEEHTRKHTGEKPFTCDVCHKSFSHKSYFRVHTKKHTESKQFPCTICQQAFVTSTDLVRHERKHAKEKSYRCSNCNQDFIQQSKLIAHWKKQKCNAVQESQKQTVLVPSEKSQEIFMQAQEFEVVDPNLQNVALQNVDLVLEQADFNQPIVVTSIGGLLNSSGVPVILTQTPTIPYSMSSVT